MFILHLNFDVENNCLIISYYGREAYFTKKDGNLIILKSNWLDAKNILGKCGARISFVYDKFIEDISFHRDHIKNISSTNSNFKINTNKYGIYLSETKKEISEFILSSNIYDLEYDYDCNSNNITTVCRNREDEIFKRVFINISDCPEWMQEELYSLRLNQLVEEAKKENKENKKQKRLELVRKLNPFRKK